MKYDNSMHALRAMLKSSDGEEECKRGRITKFSTMLHTSREGLNYYFVEVTGSNGCRYVIQAHGEEAEAFQKETKGQTKREEKSVEMSLIPVIEKPIEIDKLVKQIKTVLD